MTKIAFIFPGQGSQAVGMGKACYDGSAKAKALFAEANEALGEDLAKLCFEGPAAKLMLTENTQPAILTVSIALYKALDRTPDLAAGHSLGEYSALVAAGVLKFCDAVRLVRLRGRFMQEAVPAGHGVMYAVVGHNHEELHSAIAEYGDNQVDVANYNSPKQVVISGATAQVTAVVKALKSLRSLKLPVSAPFHSRLMHPAAERLRHELELVHFSEPQFPIVRNIDAVLVTTAAQARDGLIRQVASPVRWTDTILSMTTSQQINRFLEVGPGKVLTGLIGQINPQTERQNLQSLEDIEAVSGWLSPNS